MARNTYNVDESLETPFNIKNFARCKKYVKNSAKNLILGLFLSLTTTVLALLGPLFMKAVIDNIDKQVSVGTKDIKFLVIIGIAYLFCLFLSEFL